MSRMNTGDLNQTVEIKANCSSVRSDGYDIPKLSSNQEFLASFRCLKDLGLVLTDQLKTHGVSKEQISMVTNNIKPENISSLATTLPGILAGLNIPTDTVQTIIGNVMKDGFQMSDITDVAGKVVSNAVAQKVASNPLEAAKNLLGGMFK